MNKPDGKRANKNARTKTMSINYKELLCGHMKEMYDDAHVLQTRREPSRIQARHRSERSDCLEYTPFEEVRDQDHDQSRQINSCPTQTGDTR
jgi:hypothetical protein